jgi:hypothetical protein
MFINIITEYEKITLYSEKNVNSDIIEEEITKIQNEFILWEAKFNQYLKEKNICLKDLDYKKDNLIYAMQKNNGNNKFLEKRFQDHKEKEEIIINYRYLNKHPKYTFENKLIKYGFQEISKIKPNLTIQVNMDKDTIFLKK